MTTSQLGRLEKVDMRSVWSSESGDFTPWLAKQDNLSMLGEVLELDLELEEQEKHVGPFRADILCKDTATGNWVLVENQIERTDHGHLGQLITYAAGLKAVTIVWIASNFTDEHRAAIDWLNEVTDEGINFFGLEIEAWRIGDSAVAPKFNVVSKPNDWSRQVTEVTKSDLGEIGKMQLEFWTQFADFMRLRKSTVKPQKPFPQTWMNFALGTSSVLLYSSINIRERKISVGLSTVGMQSKGIYYSLFQDKSRLEELFGEPLGWQEAAGKVQSYVYLQRLDANITDKSLWAEYFQWIAEKLEKFHRVFGPIVRNIVLPES